MIDDTAFIHPKAQVDRGCTIGARTKIWQFASVIRGAMLGDDCTVASGACLDGSRVGNRSILCHNLAAGPGFLIGSFVFIGPNCTLANDAWPRAEKLGWNADAFDGDNWAIIIEDGATIGANCVVLPGVRIGANAMIAAGSVVERSVAANNLWKDGKATPIKRAPPRMRFVRDQVVEAVA